MNLKIYSLVSVLILLHVTFLATSKAEFTEEAIFEGEDIYSQALPPETNITYTSVIPGTKWCGPGNKAASYDDLGRFRDVDMCCRDHDHCDGIIEPNAIVHGITNSGMFPILKCTCEQKFINCLQAINSTFSNTLGRIYYGSKKSCLALGRPIVSCSQYHQGAIRKRCIRYTVDKTQSKIWQLYDMPFYSMYTAPEH